MSTRLVISASGVRGVVGAGLTPEVATNFAAAFGVRRHGRVLVGCDTRPSGRVLRHAVFAGLMSVGCTAVDAGVCPTPSLQLATRQMQAQGAIMITGSHNPQGWNALKFVRSDGMFLFPEEGGQLACSANHLDFARCPWDELGTLERASDVVSRHREHVLRLVDVEAIARHGYKVVVDACNGAGWEAAPRLLEALGCRVTCLHCRPSGIFPRPPEPTPAHLGQLCQAVALHQADIGFAHDADADRLAIVAPGGTALSEEYTLALSVYHVLQRSPGPVVINMSTSNMVETIAGRYGCPVLRTPVGDIHVSQKMRQVHAVIGGEGNGGVIYPPANYARDGLMAAALILELLAYTRADLSSLCRQLPSYWMEKRKLRAGRFDAAQFVPAFRRQFPEADVNTEDGLRVTLNGAWIHVRPSGTEPVVRIICEAPDRREAERLLCAVAEIMDISTFD